MGAGYSMKARAEEADIYIYEDVGSGWFGGVSAKQFATDLKALGAVTTINLHVNSFGGEVFEGLAIYRQLADHSARIVAHVDGIAASIASVIIMAADEILITENGMIMVHDASGGCFGRAEDMRKIADLLDTITGTIAEVYVARTGMDAPGVRALMSAETWMTAAEAVANGFASSIVENLRVAAYSGDVARHQFKHAPQALLTSPVVAELPVNPLAPVVPLTPPVAKNPIPLVAQVALQRARLAAHTANRSAA